MEKTIIKTSYAEVIRKENGKYWLKQKGKEDAEVVLIHDRTMRNVYIPPELKWPAKDYDATGYTEDMTHYSGFVKARTFTTWNDAFLRLTIRVLNGHQEKWYETIGPSIADKNYAVKNLELIPESDIEYILGYISGKNIACDEYAGDIIEALSEQWKHVVILNDNNDDEGFRSYIIFLNSDKVFDVLKDKYVKENQEKSNPVFPFK